MKKCKEGHYYCYQDSKCKPIPKGFRRGVGGYLRREREDEKEDSKKNGNGNGKSNGSSNGNGNNGNGSGNGNGSSGGNGGGNGSGGVGESFETIQNSDGETTAVVVDIIGPMNMRPRLNGEGVWKGTHITEMGNRIRKGGYTILGSGNKKDSSKGPNEQTPVDYRSVGEGLPLAKKDYTGKINSDVLKAYPELDPTKPGDYIKLKRLSAKIRKAHYEPEGSLTEVSLNPSQFLGALNKAKQMSRTSKLNQAMVDANKTNNDPNLTKSDAQVTQVGDQPPIDPMIAKGKKKKLINPVKNLDDFEDPNTQININNYKLDQIKNMKKKKYDQAHYEPDGELVERKMTEKEKRKDDRLKKKYDKSDMKKSMQKQYGKEEGKKVYFATIRKQAMEEEKKKDHEPEMIRNQLKTAKRASKRIKRHTLKKDNFKAWVQSKITKASDYLDTAADYLDSKDDMKEELNKKDKPYIKKLVKNLRKGSKTHAKQADKLEKAMNEESNPRIPRKKGQPANSKKHSDLYTDENPKGTIHGLGFKDVATAKASVTKIRKSNRSHAHKIQAAVAMEQRAREMGKTSEAAVYRKFINSMKKKTKS